MIRSISSFLLVLWACHSYGQPKKITIGILADRQDPASEVLLNQLKNTIEDVAGGANTIVFKKVLENDFDLTQAKAQYELLLEDKTDIILAFGIVNSIMIYQEEEHPKPTITLGAINQDFVRIARAEKSERIDNVAFHFVPSSYSDDLEAFETLYEYRNIGIIVDKKLMQILPLQAFFDQYFAEKEQSFQLIPVENGSASNTSLEGIDAVYFANHFLNDTESNILIERIIQQKLPSISANGIRDVEKGILLTYQPELDAGNFFRRIALNVEATIDGANPADLPVSYDSIKYLSINYKIAGLIDFPLRYSMLGYVNFVEGLNQEYQAEQSYSLVELMQGVLENNLALSVNQQDIDLSQQDLKISRSNYLPNLDANASAAYVDPELAAVSNGQNPEFSTLGNLSLEQLLYSEQATANIDIQKSLLGAQREVYNSARLDAMLNASIAYFNALVLKTSVRIQNRNLQLTKKNLQIAEENFELGAGGKSNILRLRSQLAQNTQDLINATNSLGQAYLTINQLMNKPINAKVEIEDAELSKGLFENYEYQTLLQLFDDPRTRERLTTFFVQEALQNSPELKNVGYNYEAAQRSFSLNAEGRFVPTLALQGNYNYAFSRSGEGSIVPPGFPIPPDGSYNVGVNLSIPIFQRNQRNINRQTAAIQKNQLGTQRESIRLNIEKDVNDIVLEMIKQIANIEISKANEQYSKESLELSQEEYRAGAIPVIQLLDAQNNFLQAQLIRATAEYNYFIVAMQLERALGHFFLMSSKASNDDFIQRAQEFILSEN